MSLIDWLNSLNLIEMFFSFFLSFFLYLFLSFFTSLLFTFPSLSFFLSFFLPLFLSVCLSFSFLHVYLLFFRLVSFLFSWNFYSLMITKKLMLKSITRRRWTRCCPRTSRNSCTKTSPTRLWSWSIRTRRTPTWSGIMALGRRSRPLFFRESRSFPTPLYFSFPLLSLWY